MKIQHCPLLLLPLACQPLNDLDAATRGSEPIVSESVPSASPVDSSFDGTTPGGTASSSASTNEAVPGGSTTTSPVTASSSAGTNVENVLSSEPTGTSGSGLANIGDGGVDTESAASEQDSTPSDGSGASSGDTAGGNSSSEFGSAGTDAGSGTLETNTGRATTDSSQASTTTSSTTTSSTTTSSTTTSSTETGTTPGGDAAELPIDLPNNPVAGVFTVASDAEWEVNGQFIPTFEILTPSANYWVVKDLGMIVSLVDPDASDPRQWIAYSSGFRPLRGLPSFGTFDNSPEPMVTTLDTESQTQTHLRLMSNSQSGSWRLVYDFYPTHVTLTVNAAPVPYGMAYRGVLAGALEDTDRFVRADGTSQSAIISSVADLAGPAEWSYLVDATVGRSLFLIQHADDALTDRFQVKDNDSALLSFGDGNLTRLPLRFSFGLINSANHQTVKTRAEFVINAIQ